MYLSFQSYLQIHGVINIYISKYILRTQNVIWTFHKFLPFDPIVSEITPRGHISIFHFGLLSELIAQNTEHM